MAAAVQSARLGPAETEVLVGLWRRAKDATERRTLLSTPRASLRAHHPDTRRSSLSPGLSPAGQRLCRSLHRFEVTALETSRRLLSEVTEADRTILAKELDKAAVSACRLVTALSSSRTGGGEGGPSGSGETS
jgi:hypothetical protein